MHIFISVLLVASVLLLIKNTSIVLAKGFLSNNYKNSDLSLLTMALWPALLAWLLNFLLYFFPGQSSLLIFLVLFLLTNFVFLKFQEDKSTFTHDLSNHFKNESFFWFIFIFSFVIPLFALPILGNDPVEYLKVTEILSSTLDSSLYPVLDYKEFNFYGPWSHPFGFMGVNLLFKLIGFPIVWAHKLVSLYYMVLSLLLVKRLNDNWSKRVESIWPMILFLFSNLFYTNGIGSHIDVFRIFYFSLAIYFVFLLPKKVEIKHILLTGVIASTSVFAHSIGILALPLCFVGFVLIRDEKAWKSLWTFIVIGSLSLFFISFDLYKNIITYGAVIADVKNIPTWNLPEYDVKGYFKLMRGLDTPFRNVFYGVFQGLTRPEFFSFHFYFAFAGILFFIKQKKYEKIGIFASAVIISWLTLSLTGFIADTNYFVRNPRYFMSLLLFSSILGGLCCQNLYNYLQIILKKDIVLFWTAVSAFVICFLLWFKFYYIPLKKPQVGDIMFFINFLRLYLHISLSVVFTWIYLSSILVLKNKKLCTFIYLVCLIGAHGGLSTLKSFKVVYWNTEVKRIDQFLEQLSTAKKIISFAPSSPSYYSKNTVVNYMTPDLLDILDIKSKEKLLDYMNIQKIGFLHFVDGGMYPLLVDSILNQVITDLEVALPIYQERGHNIYEIKPSSLNVVTSIYINKTKEDIIYLNQNNFMYENFYLSGEIKLAEYCKVRVSLSNGKKSYILTEFLGKNKKRTLRTIHVKDLFHKAVIKIEPLFLGGERFFDENCEVNSIYLSISKGKATK